MALDLAVEQTVPAGPLGTAPVFHALSEVDSYGRWSTLWLRIGYHTATDWATRDSSAGDSGATWSGVALSVQLDTCLNLVAELVAAYDMVTVPVGALALALVADRASGAARILLDAAGIDHWELLELIQDELLGARLNGLGDLLARTSRMTRIIPALTATPADWHRHTAVGQLPDLSDDIDLLAVLASEGQIEETSNGELIRTVVTDLAADARRFGTIPARTVIEAAGTEFDTAVPDGAQILFALVDNPSPALVRLLAVAGVSAAEIAAGAIELREPAMRRSTGTIVLSVLNMFLLLLVFALVIRHAVGTGEWWELAFLCGASLGPPAVSSGFTAVLSVGLGVVDPLAGIVLAAEAATSWLRERSELTALTALTGVRLMPAEYRRFRQRRSYLAEARRQRDVALLPWRTRRMMIAAQARRTDAEEML